MERHRLVRLFVQLVVAAAALAACPSAPRNSSNPDVGPGQVERVCFAQCNYFTRCKGASDDDARARCEAYCRGAGPEGGGTSKDVYRFGVDFATARADFTERYLDCVAHLPSCARAILNLDDYCLKRAAAEAPATDTGRAFCAARRSCKSSTTEEDCLDSYGMIADDAIGPCVSAPCDDMAKCVNRRTRPWAPPD
jgi:hypothetical protein